MKTSQRKAMMARIKARKIRESKTYECMCGKKFHEEKDGKWRKYSNHTC